MSIILAAGAARMKLEAENYEARIAALEAQLAEAADERDKALEELGKVIMACPAGQRYMPISATVASMRTHIGTLEVQLAEALKALDDIETHALLVPVHTSQVTAGQLMSSKLTMIRDIASKAARRVREAHGGER